MSDGRQAAISSEWYPSCIDWRAIDAWIGLGASELYVVKSGEFEVLERRQGINMRVNRKARGDCFGEVSLMYSCPRSATVAALTDAVVWVLERHVFRSAQFLPRLSSSGRTLVTAALVRDG